ncbi:MAG: hypothetical protein QOD98_4484 [Nocardioidaceae bacterium]|jgi:hypothetical protein|nr:hypothetical protein [Nocardioidaceae bacterium]
MDEASRATWSWAFFTLGCTLGLGAIVRWARWQNDGGNGGTPQVLWTLGFLALGFFLVSLQLRLSGWLSRWVGADEAEQERRQASRSDWVDQ